MKKINAATTSMPPPDHERNGPPMIHTKTRRISGLDAEDSWEANAMAEYRAATGCIAAGRYYNSEPNLTLLRSTKFAPTPRLHRRALTEIGRDVQPWVRCMVRATISCPTPVRPKPEPQG